MAGLCVHANDPQARVGEGWCLGRRGLTVSQVHEQRAWAPLHSGGGSRPRMQVIHPQERRQPEIKGNKTAVVTQ